jgi:hypothetical protein
MSVGDYALGVLCLALSVIPLVLAARAVRSKLLPLWTGAPARLAEAVLLLSALVAIAEVLGTVGAFERAPFVASCLVVALVTGMVAARRRALPGEPPAGPRGANRAGVLPALAGAGLVLGQWSVAVRRAFDVGMASPDTLWYHLPFAARFVQETSLTRLHFAEVEPITAFYPANGELFHAVGMLLLGRDTLSPLMNVGFLSLGLLAAWCIGRPKGAAPVAMLAAALVFTAPLLWSTQAGQAGNDIVGATFLAAAAGLVASGRGAGPSVTLAALAAGLALGTKLSLVVPALALVTCLVWLAPRGVRLRRALAGTGCLLLTGGFWYARNLVRTGSPLPWIDLPPLGFTAPPRPLTRDFEFSVSHYLTDFGAWRAHFLPGLDYALGWGWPILLALAIAGIVVALTSGPGWPRGLGLVAGVSLAAYLFTPNSASGPEGFPWAFGLNMRYAIPALTLGVCLLSVSRLLHSRRRRRLAAASLLAGVVFNLVDYEGPWSSADIDPAALLIAAALTVGLALMVAGPARRRSPARAAALLGAGALIAVLGWFVQRDYLRDRYAQVGPNVPKTSVWAREVQGARIGVLGFFSQYPLYGADLSNHVEQIGRREDNGGFVRLSSCASWRRAVSGAGFRYLVIAPVVSPNLPRRPREPAREVRWTEADPRAEEVLRDGPLVTFRLARRLRPETCERPAAEP